MVEFMRVAGKKVKCTDLVYLNGILAYSIGVSRRMVKSMVKDGSRNQMELAMARNMRTEKK
jgi:hypothetical protein